MQKVLVNCQLKHKDKINHLLKVNRYETLEFIKDNDVILLMELYDYQVNLLIKTMHNYVKNQEGEVSINICHKISFYD